MKTIQLLAIFVASALAPATAQKQMTSAPTSSPITESSLLSAKLRPIADLLAGRWSIAWMDKDGHGIGEGEEVWEIARGGAFIEENRSTVNGKSADDYAAMWWDSKAQRCTASGVTPSSMTKAVAASTFLWKGRQSC